MKRILFFAEPATLAHVVRPIVLASALDRDRYHVALATGPDFRRFAVEAGLDVRELWAIGTRAYLAAVAAGRVVFPYDVLKRYVKEDLRHLREFKPDLVVGDFRLSLAVSARLAGVPYLALSNAYWAPFARARYEVPVHPVTRFLGPRIADPIFRALSPAIMAIHSLPMHRLRKDYGMPSLGFNLRRVFTEADACLLADVPEMVPDEGRHSDPRYVFIGPITWSPKGDVPASLVNTRDSRPLVYVALGSSGDSKLVLQIVKAALSLECRVAVASSDDHAEYGALPGVHTFPFLPGDKIARLARVVVCNGGSPSTHQALREGTPVLGIPSNLDQLLNMQFISAWGAGLALRADMATASALHNSVRRLLHDDTFPRKAKAAAQALGAYPAENNFRREVAKAVG